MINWQKFGDVSKRESNIELFRIILMLLIVAHHFVVNSGLTSLDGPLYSSGLNWRTVFLLIFGAWGKIGINCFVLITGYFMCTMQISAKKFCKLLFAVLFYNLVITSFFWYIGYESLNIYHFIYFVFPFHNISTGFVSCFLLYYLSIPFINRLIGTINEREHKCLIALFLFTYTFFGTVPFFYVNMNYVSWFIVIHFIAAYIHKYPKAVYRNCQNWSKRLAFLILADIASILFCYVVGEKTGKSDAWFFVTDCNTLLALLTAFASFLVFKQLKIEANRWINLIAKGTFGVLLIHANSDIMRRWLWKDTVDVVGHYSSSVLIPYAIGSVILIFIVCVFIDLLRQYFVEPLYLKLCDRMIEHMRYWKLIERL